MSKPVSDPGIRGRFSHDGGDRRGKADWLRSQFFKSRADQKGPQCPAVKGSSLALIDRQLSIGDRHRQNDHGGLIGSAP